MRDSAFELRDVVEAALTRALVLAAGEVLVLPSPQ